MTSKGKNNINAVSVDYENTGGSANKKRLVFDMFRKPFKGNNLIPKKKKRKK